MNFPHEDKLNGLDLFSGIGGISLALAPWVRPVAYCERDTFAQAVLLSRMAENALPLAPIWDDVRTLRGSDLPRIDIIYGGFPCQDISVAGTGRGLDGERSGLFFEILRLANETQPAFLFLENVPAIAGRGLDRVAKEISTLGYDCRWGVLSAFDVGAPHRRDRWWLLGHRPFNRSATPANTDGLGLWDWWQRSQERETKAGCQSRNDGETQPVADSDRAGLERQRYGTERIEAEQSEPWNCGGWSIEPDVGRVVNGVPARLDRLRGLGNAVVPRCAREAFERLIGLKGVSVNYV